MARLDLEHLARQTMNDAELQRDVLQIFEQQMSEKVVDLERGESAVRDLAHNIKGSARGVGAFEVALLAEKLEAKGQTDPALVAQLRMAIADVLEEIRVLLHR